MSSLEALRTWFKRDLCHLGQWQDRVDEIALPGHLGGSRVKFTFYTDTYCYTLDAYEKAEGGGGTLYFAARLRKPPAGKLGSAVVDLCQGELSEDTWTRVICGMLSHELIPFNRPPRG